MLEVKKKLKKTWVEFWNHLANKIDQNLWELHWIKKLRSVPSSKERKAKHAEPKCAFVNIKSMYFCNTDPHLLFVSHSLLHFVSRLSSTQTSPATLCGLSPAIISAMWSAISTLLCHEFSTTPFLRECPAFIPSHVWCIGWLTENPKGDLYKGGCQKVHACLQCLWSFYVGSPSICHSDSDLSEGSRKYSPSSETSVETQRACGKTDLLIKHVLSAVLCLAGWKRTWHLGLANAPPDVQLKAVVQTKDRSTRGMHACEFAPILCQKQLLVSSLTPLFCFPLLFSSPVCVSQEASRRPMPLCVTIMASAARRKCSG